MNNKTSKSELQALRERIRAATGPDRGIDGRLHFYDCERNSAVPCGATNISFRKHEQKHGWHTAYIAHKGFIHGFPEYTASIDAALALVERVLPGWTWRVASCSVSDDAWIIPDFNHPLYGQNFRDFWPEECQRDPIEYLSADVDRRPPGNPALAILESMLIAMIDMIEQADE
ncbi:MAG: hypothetical protein OER56_01720 [Hyphomicrobiales bacterium]|nr:hypothetical protein [Hyphomicrobiales bacterium]